MLYSESLKEINPFNLLQRRLTGGLTIVGIKGLFNLAETGITRTDGWKVELDKFQLK